MKVSKSIGCKDFPCTDVAHEKYMIPDIDMDLTRIQMVMISECAADKQSDNYYAKGSPLFAQTTMQALEDAGKPVGTIKDLIGLGIYLTMAIKCSKCGYGIQTSTIDACSRILEQELMLFPNLKVLMLMGDTAIRGVNLIARRNREGRIIPAGSTYKIRGGTFTWRGLRVFPSYLQAGPSFFIEKSKRRMIAEDIRAALNILD